MHNLHNCAWPLSPSSDLVTWAHDLASRTLPVASLCEMGIITTPNSQHMKYGQVQETFNTTPRVCTHLLSL